jgi:hypothetical protein
MICTIFCLAERCFDYVPRTLKKAFNLMCYWTRIQQCQKWKSLRAHLKRLEDMLKDGDPARKHETADLEGKPPMAAL